MASKRWRLVVTELGASTPLHEAMVEAPNWVTALQKGRVQMGERGGVPPGASCAVSPDGKVTISDPMARRVYTVFPERPSLVPDRKSNPPGIPADSVPGREGFSVRPPESRPPSVRPPAGRTTMSYERDPDRASVPPPARASVPPSESVPAETERASVAPAPAAAQPASTPSVLPPPPKMPDPSLPGYSLLSERRENPTAENPLLYRERTYVMSQGATAEQVEEVLRAEFKSLREELAAQPKGKLLNLAVFDHKWSGRPSAAPLLTLQWKDWRGEPELIRPRRSSLPPRGSLTPAAPSLAPAPSSGSMPAPVLPTKREPARQPGQVIGGSIAPAGAVLAAAPAATPQPSAVPEAKPAARKSEPPPPTANKPDERAAFTAVSQEQAEQIAPPRKRIATPTPIPAVRKGDHHDDRLAHAFESLQDLYFLSTPAEGLDFAVRLLNDLIPSEAASACLYDINTDEFRFVALLGPGGDERRGEAIPRSAGLFGASAERPDSPFRVDQAGAHGRFDPGVDGRLGVEVITALYMPLIREGRLLGMLQLLNRKAQPRYIDGDSEIVAYVAKSLTEFLHNAKLAPQRNK